MIYFIFFSIVIYSVITFYELLMGEDVTMNIILLILSIIVFFTTIADQMIVNLSMCNQFIKISNH